MILYILIGVIFAVTAAIALMLIFENTGSGMDEVNDIVLTKRNTSADKTDQDIETSEEIKKFALLPVPAVMMKIRNCIICSG